MNNSYAFAEGLVKKFRVIYTFQNVPGKGSGEGRSIVVAESRDDAIKYITKRLSSLHAVNVTFCEEIDGER